MTAEDILKEILSYCESHAKGIREDYKNYSYQAYDPCDHSREGEASACEDIADMIREKMQAIAPGDA